MAEGGDGLEKKTLQSTEGEVGADQWADKLWDINKELGKATEHAPVDLMRVQAEVAKAEQIAKEILAGGPAPLERAAATEALLSLNYATENGIDAPELKKLVQSNPAE